jgi:SRSO17 transposase
MYLRGALTMDSKRNYANIARRVAGPDNDGQNLQQFMSDSPWFSAGVFKQIQSEIAAYPEIQDGMLTLDESADEKAGTDSAGAARQYLGREGKVDVGQMGVVLGYHSNDTWTMVDAELYLPEKWFRASDINTISESAKHPLEFANRDSGGVLHSVTGSLAAVPTPTPSRSQCPRATSEPA